MFKRLAVFATLRLQPVGVLLNLFQLLAFRTAMPSRPRELRRRSVGACTRLFVPKVEEAP